MQFICTTEVVPSLCWRFPIQGFESLLIHGIPWLWYSQIKTKTMSYLKKQVATCLTNLMDRLTNSWQCVHQVHHHAETKSKETEPKQTGNIGFKSDKSNQEAVCSMLHEVELNFSILNENEHERKGIPKSTPGQTFSKK